MDDGGMFFAATRPRSRESYNFDADDASLQVQDEANDGTECYEIVVLQLPSSPTQPQPMPFVAPGLINEAISRHLLPHPSLPLLFAFTPSKILLLHLGTAASSTSVHPIHAFLPAPALPSTSRLWGLTSSLKTLFAGSGSVRLAHAAMYRVETQRHTLNNLSHSLSDGACKTRNNLFRTAPRQPQPIFDDTDPLLSTTCIMQVPPPTSPNKT